MTISATNSVLTLTGIEPDIVSIAFDDGTVLVFDDFETALSDIGLGLSASGLDVIHDPITETVVADAGVDLDVYTSSTVALNGSSSTGPVVSYLWEQMAGPTVTIINSTSAIASFNPVPTGVDHELEFRLTVSNSPGQTSTDSVSISVLNSSPISSAGSDRDAAGGSVVTLDGRNSSDPSGGSIVSYSWTQSLGPTVDITNANTSLATFTAPEATQLDQVLVFELAVTDNGGLTVYDPVAITVRAVDALLVAVAGADKTATSGSVVNLSGSASLSGVSYAWTQVSGPGVVISNPNISNPFFVAPSVVNPSDVVLSLVASNDSQVSEADEIVITVSAAEEVASTKVNTISLVSAGFTSIESTLVSPEWSQITGPQVELAVKPDGVTFVAPLNSSTDYTIVLVATDSVTTEFFIVTVLQSSFSDRRIRDVISRARVTLGDKNGDRYSNDELVTLIDEGQEDFCKNTSILKGVKQLRLVGGARDIRMPDNCWQLTRASYNDCTLPLLTYSEVDSMINSTAENIFGIRADWENEVGEPRAIIYDKNNLGSVRVYPMPEDTGEEVLDDLFGVITEFEGYDYNDVVNENFGVVGSVVEDDNSVRIYYVRLPSSIETADSSIDIPSMFDVALKYYIVGHSFLNDLDTGWQDKGMQQLKFYDREVQRALDSESKNHTRIDSRRTDYRSGF